MPTFPGFHSPHPVSRHTHTVFDTPSLIVMATASTSSSAGNAQEQQQPRFSGVRTLHKGACGTFVQLAIDRANGDNEVCIKYIPRDHVAAHHKLVQREVLNHHQLSLYKHPHLVELLEVILTPRYLGIVMNFVSGVSLTSYLMAKGGGLGEETARFIFQQLILTVEFMHKMGKCNRDIKLENIMVVDKGLPLIKLCNFGLSKDKAADSSPATQAGSALFTAPEVLLNVQGRSYCGEAVDVWSCGVVLHMLLFGCHPFLSAADMLLTESEQIVKLVENEVKGHLQMPPEAVGSAVADLLQRMLVPAAHHRYKLADIMAHPWFRTSLPPGALQLNATYLQQGNLVKGRQSAVEVRKLLAAAMLRTKATRPNSVPAPQAQQDALPSRPGSGMSIAQSDLHASPATPAIASAPSPGGSYYSQPFEQQQGQGQQQGQQQQQQGAGPTARMPRINMPRIDPATFVIPEGAYASVPSSGSGNVLVQGPQAQAHGHGQYRPVSEPTAGAGASAAEAAVAAAAAAYAAAVSAGFSMSEEQLHQSRGEDADAAALVQMWRREQAQQGAGDGGGDDAEMQWAMQ
ncbi:hypothetical protein FOA52_003036 [Chlamydomonas sp. UWO 241]|nr:hypothetical protein FOA52_003036 [Chlamydomonas sp. UWO 241]